jgi:hypothetical protein
MHMRCVVNLFQIFDFSYRCTTVPGNALAIAYIIYQYVHIFVVNWHSCRRRQRSKRDEN